MMRKSYILLAFLAITLLTFAQNPRTQLQITARQTTVPGYTDREVIISGRSDLIITAQTSAAALNNSVIHLNSEDSWVIFENLRPTHVIDSLIRHIFVNNRPAVNRSNVRVAIYAHGAVVIPHSPDYRPLTFFSGQNFSGESVTFPLYTYHNGLGAMDRRMRSFRLKRGYMATFATESDGMGYSRVFIADNEDLEFATMNFLLDETVSFVRVFEWDYVSKKGWCGSGSGGGNDAERVRATWWYSWSADQQSRTNQSYVPIRQNLGWPSWREINGLTRVNHLLGFNEPDRPDQSNMTVAQALAMWPEFMRSGLRIGTPATASPNAWLYEFVDSVKARNWRLDFLAVHAYWGGKSPQSWYHDLRQVHLRTGLPIWIKEWNNGANWTTERWPNRVGNDVPLTPANAQKQLNDLRAILNVLDTASFIERHSIYNWVQDARAIILSGDFRVTTRADGVTRDTVFLQNGLTPAGVMFRDTRSRMAFNRRNEVIPTWRIHRNPTFSVFFGVNTVVVTVNDRNGSLSRGFILERRVGNGNFEVIVDSDSRTVRNHSEALDISQGAVQFRVRTKILDGTLSHYSPAIGYDITQGDEQVQFGRIRVSSNDWNSVFFNQPFSAIPAVVTGPPSNNNVSALMTPRVRFISRTSRFQIQASTWQYQNLTSLANEEVIPYMAMLPGTYDFNGVRGLSATSTASAAWTTVTFPTPFEVAPVVFVNQLLSPTSFATVVRVRNVTPTGFQVRIFREEGVTTAPGTETISYIALTPGRGEFNGHRFVVGRTANDFVTASARQILFNDTIDNPIFMAQMQTCNDEATAALRLFHLSKTGAFVFKQRERSVSTGSVAAESAGWVVIDPVKIVQSVGTVRDNQLSITPNPVRDVISISNQIIVGEQVQIFSLSGVLVKTITLESNQIDVRDMLPGSYLIRGSSFSPTKFIKL